MKIQGTLINDRHPEYGSVVVQFPIPMDEYENVLGLLEGLEIGDTLQRDCHVLTLGNGYHVLGRLEGTQVNLDELDYLAKRLDSFSSGEAAQFQAMAEKLDLRDIKDFINLTFCCQQATVITDFSDLEAVGRRHYMNLNDGCAPAEELEALDGYETALLLIDTGAGTVTEYGVVYDNGMELEQVYDGRHFPAYDHDDSLIALSVMPNTAGDNKSPIDYLYLPAPDSLIDRTFLRSGLGPGDLLYSIEYESLPEAVSDAVDIASEDIQALNSMCHAVRQLDSREMDKLSAAVLMAKPESAAEISEIAKNLELFDFIPGVRDAEEYGKYMIQESGHFEYDPNLDNFYNYSQYGWDRINREQGQFNELGYIVYQGEMTMEELLHGDPAEQMDQQMDGMGGM